MKLKPSLPLKPINKDFNSRKYLCRYLWYRFRENINFLNLLILKGTSKNPDCLILFLTNATHKSAIIFQTKKMDRL